MTFLFSHYRILFFFILFSLFSFNTYSQKKEKVELLSADFLKYNKSKNSKFQMLSGNVSFKYQDAVLYCDSANLYINRDFVETYGHVYVIVNDSVQLWGDTLKIDGDNDMATVLGNVKLVDNQITLKGRQLFYNLKNNTASYYSRTHINDKENYLTSLIGHYYTKEKKFFFKDSVFLKNDKLNINSDTMLYNTINEIAYFYGRSEIVSSENSLICYFGKYDTKNDIGNFSKNTTFISNPNTLICDSLMYNRNLSYGEAFRNINFGNTTDNIYFYGNYGKFFEKDSSFFITGDAVMKIINDDDTLNLHGDTLFVYNDTVYKQRIMKTYNSVRFFNVDFQGICDSLIFFTKDSIIYLYTNPIIWLDSTQLLGDTMVLKYLNKEINNVLLNNHALIVSKENDNFNQIKGNKIKAIFKDNKINYLVATDNTESIYFVYDDNKQLVGINKAKSNSMKILFNDNSVNKITLYSTPSGFLYPEKELSEADRKLPEFKWLQNLRPLSLNDILYEKK